MDAGRCHRCQADSCDGSDRQFQFSVPSPRSVCQLAPGPPDRRLTLAEGAGGAVGWRAIGQRNAGIFKAANEHGLRSEAS